MISYMTTQAGTIGQGRVIHSIGGGFLPPRLLHPRRGEEGVERARGRGRGAAEPRHPARRAAAPAQVRRPLDNTHVSPPRSCARTPTRATTPRPLDPHHATTDTLPYSCQGSRDPLILYPTSWYCLRDIHQYIASTSRSTRTLGKSSGLRCVALCDLACRAG